MTWRKIVAEYFTFTRGNRIAVLVLLCIITGVFFLPDFLVRAPGKSVANQDSTWIIALKKMERKEPGGAAGFSKYNEENSADYQYDRKAGTYAKRSKIELFYFDPNTLSTAGWKKLGLRDKTISTIQNYLSKGGKFRKPEDLGRIYGLFPDEYERIAPFIKIESITAPDKVFSGYTDNKEPVPLKTYTPKYSTIDINTADADAFMSLPGIGPAFSARIIKFREKLGGFYSIEQVGETYGLPDSTFQKIKQYLNMENSSVRKININSVTIEELKAHPYVKWSVANAIIAYRNEHGEFSKQEDLKKIMAVTEDLYAKIYPYIAIQ